MYELFFSMAKNRTINLSVCRAGQLDMSTALGLTNYLDKEREYVPWSSALGHLGFIGSMLTMRPSYGFYRVSGGLKIGEGIKWKLKKLS